MKERKYKNVDYTIEGPKEGVVRVHYSDNSVMTFLNIFTDLDIEDRVVPVFEQYIERFIEH